MNYLRILQIVIAVALAVSILLQNRGGGLSGIFGGASNVYMAKRGLEKKLFVATIVLAALFLAISLANIIL
jgi:protein translocase SecG subunit